jgi:hypothetical protein
MLGAILVVITKINLHIIRRRNNLANQNKYIIVEISVLHLCAKGRHGVADNYLGVQIGRLVLEFAGATKRMSKLKTSIGVVIGLLWGAPVKMLLHELIEWMLVYISMYL